MIVFLVQVVEHVTKKRYDCLDLKGIQDTHFFCFFFADGGCKKERTIRNEQYQTPYF